MLDTIRHKWFILVNFKPARLRKIAVAILLAVVLALVASGCSSDSSSTVATGLQKAQDAQTQDSNNIENNQPVHVYQWSQYEQTLLDVEDIEANGENTTSFGFSNNGVLMWKCASLGMPVPADTQLTSPDQIVKDPNGGGYRLNSGSLLMPQQDPIGGYTGATSGTNTLCADGPGGKQYIQYWEGYVDAVSGPATYSPSTGVTLTGNPVPIKQVNVKAANAQASAKAAQVRASLKPPKS